MGHAEAIDRPSSVVWQEVERWPSRLCADDTRASADVPLRNAHRRTLQELFGVTPGNTVIEYRSPDWRGPEAVASVVRDILAARPRYLSPFIDWAEGADLRRQGFVVSIAMLDGASVRLAVAGYQVCLRDAKGDYWYFRNLPLDQ